MGTITKPYGDFTNNVDVADASKVNQQINTLYTWANGNVDLSNLNASAFSNTASASKLAQRDANGYLAGVANVLSGGTKVQSGIVNVTTGSTAGNYSTSTTFPTAFSSTPIVFVTTGGDGDPQHISAATAGGESTTGFIAYFYQSDTVTRTLPVRYLAIGT